MSTKAVARPSTGLDVTRILNPSLADGPRPMALDLTMVNLHFTEPRVIEGFRHRGLKRLFEEDDRSKVPVEYARRLRRNLAALDAAERVEDMDIHTFRLHALKGDLRGCWAVTVRANWRVVFRFSRGKASEIDLADYH